VKAAPAIAMVGFVILLAGCGPNAEPLVGTGTQTGNGLSGRVLSMEDGLPTTGVTVRLRPATWLPGDTTALPGSVRDTVVDSLGKFRIREVPAGYYRVEMFIPDTDSRTVTTPWIPGMPPSTSTSANPGPEKAVAIYCQVVAQTETVLPDQRLQESANLYVEMPLTDTTRWARVDIFGLDRSTTCTVAGRACIETIRDIPAGTYFVRIWSTRFGIPVMGITKTLVPGRTDTIRTNEWDHSLKEPKPGEE